MKHTDLKIEGMSCTSCADNIEKAIKILPGIQQAAVHYEAQSASIDYDEGLINENRIIEVIDHAGYQVSRAWAKENFSKVSP